MEIRAADTPEQERPNMAMTSSQMSCVMRHLNMVFKHEIDPSMGGVKHQAALSQTHAGMARPPREESIARC